MMDAVVGTEKTAEATPERPTVLLLGGTGRTGGRVLGQLLERGVRVRALVRSRDRLPAGTPGHPHLSVTVGEVTSLDGDDLAALVDGCDAVVSCLGHTTDLRGIYGQPRYLVTQAVERVCAAAGAARPERPVKFVLMSSVSVNRPGRLDARRGAFERAVVWLLHGLIPPARDNQRAADFLLEQVGASDRYVQWVAVRPDELKEGGIAPYALHEGLVDSMFRPGATNMASVADFMCELVTDDDAWAAWRGRLPVIVNAGAG